MENLYILGISRILIFLDSNLVLGIHIFQLNDSAVDQQSVTNAYWWMSMTHDQIAENDSNGHEIVLHPSQNACKFQDNDSCCKLLLFSIPQNMSTNIGWNEADPPKNGTIKE